MPLRDHFHEPLKPRRRWASLHSNWANAILRNLDGRLPPRYFVETTAHLGTLVEADVATFEEGAESARADDTGNGVATAVWAPPRPVQTVSVEFPAQDVFELRVYDEASDTRLVAAVELVSPSNKDRPDSRRTFIGKCAGYLQQQVSVILVDVVTERHSNLHEELMDFLGHPQPSPWPEGTFLYAAAYRTAKPAEHWQLDLWPHALEVGGPLPTLPLWLARDLALPLELEATYEETCRYLRIP
jgi:Protein of unknown function (DUF4058)